MGCCRDGCVAHRTTLMKNIWHNSIHHFQLCMAAVAKCHEARPMYYVWSIADPLHLFVIHEYGEHWRGWQALGNYAFCSLAVAVSHVARKYWLDVFWIWLIGSACICHNALCDLWNIITEPRGPKTRKPENPINVGDVIITHACLTLTVDWLNACDTFLVYCGISETGLFCLLFV